MIEPGAPGTAREGFSIVGVGASAGGLEAFTQLLKHLPLDTGMGFVLVQHLDPEHESALSQILSRATSLPVQEVTNNQRVEPDHIYVIPHDTNLTIERGILKLRPRPKTRVPHKPIDLFFESLSRDRGDAAIGVVLSGTATDGTLGLEAIKAEGGFTFAQDESARHDSMPRSAVAAGCVDLVLSPAEIARELSRIARHPYVAGEPFEIVAPMDGERGEEVGDQVAAHARDLAALPPGGRSHADRPSDRKVRGTHATPLRSAAKLAKDGDETPGTDARYRGVLSLLHDHSGVDFSLYKSTTIQRRIKRRMILSKHNSLADYTGFLRGNGRELDALFSDVLISVTSFFRNPEMFEALKRRVLPELLKQPGDDPLRCWVLGCSTGQEAYSIAMVFAEAAAAAPRMRKLQIFATDLNDALLEKARHGLYARTLAEDISPGRLQRFFVEENGGYRVTKGLREMVVFAKQNLIADPPFSRMDIISCRNLLIYLEPGLQQKALPTFHYALKPGGYLLLGASESIGGFSDLFESVDKKHKIFSRKAAPTSPFHFPVTPVDHAKLPPSRAPLTVRDAGRVERWGPLRGEMDAHREADRIAAHHFAPPGVLVNDALQVLQFRGSTGAYLEPPQGKASFDVLKMVREGLMLPLRALINLARKDNRTVRREHVSFEHAGKRRAVNLEIIPLRSLREPCFLILFEDAPETSPGSGRPTAADTPAARPLSKKQEQSRIAALVEELAETREYLHSIQQQHETATEELQAASEEVQSANEELQSVNEELETSKEELESANEELITVNDEMNNRNVELTQLNNDLLNVQTSSRLAILLLGRDLTIRRFSAEAQKQFDLRVTDVGHSIAHVRHGLAVAPESAELDGAAVNLPGIVAEVIASVREQEYQVRDRSGCWHSMRVRPYVTVDNQVDGAVVLLVDIDALKRTEQMIGVARDYAENIIATVREPLVVLDRNLRVRSANRSFYRLFRTEPESTVGGAFFDLAAGQWDMVGLGERLSQILEQNVTLEDYEIEHHFEGIGTRILLFNARRVVDAEKSNLILLAIEDITARRHAERALQESHVSLQSHIDELSRFNNVAIGRELRMIELKKEVNDLSTRHGVAARYPLEFEDDTFGRRATSLPGTDAPENVTEG